MSCSMILQCVIVNCVTYYDKYDLQECSEQIAWEGQDLPCTYLARHELKRVLTLQYM